LATARPESLSNPPAHSCHWPFRAVAVNGEGTIGAAGELQKVFTKAIELTKKQ
jgi:hypothetical protein